MIYTWQKEQWRQINQQREQNRLPHAMLFTGPAGTGKKDFALALAQSMLCKTPGDNGIACGHCDSCHLFNAGTHPDLKHLQPTPPENSRSANPVLSIKIDTLRELYRALNETSQFGGYRVALIEDADKMPVNAANSLLKTLEEPGQDTLLVLVSSHPHRLPVTIRSRCQSVRFAVPAESVAMAWLQQEKVANAETALKLAHGAPLLARAYSEEQQEHRTTLLQALSAGIKGEPSFLYAEKLAQMPKEPLLRWLQDWASDIGRLLALGEAANLVNEDQRKLLETRAKSVDNRKLYQFIDEITRLQRAEGIALNQQLLWENLLISWDNV